jgi:hypothetical protein
MVTDMAGITGILSIIFSVKLSRAETNCCRFATCAFTWKRITEQVKRITIFFFITKYLYPDPIGSETGD